MLQNQFMKLKLGGAQNSLCGQETTQKVPKNKYCHYNRKFKFGHQLLKVLNKIIMINAAKPIDEVEALQKSIFFNQYTELNLGGHQTTGCKR